MLQFHSRVDLGPGRGRQCRANGGTTGGDGMTDAPTVRPTGTGRLIVRLARSVPVGTRDAREGTAAFREKRAPEWTGR